MGVLLIWILNFAISWFNAWACGKSWNESKHVGGFAHFMNWMGAIMSAAGFTWCYVILGAELASTIPIEQDDGTSAPLLSAAATTALLQLGYMVVIFPILGSGLAIMLQAWAVFWRRRTLANGAVAAYDTFAMAYNISSAVQYVPEASSGLSSFFGKDSDSEDSGKLIVLLLAVMALVGGILTTRWILLNSARASRNNKAFEAQALRS